MTGLCSRRIDVQDHHRRRSPCQRDIATPNTLLAYPGAMDIGHRTVPNSSGFDLGVVRCRGVREFVNAAFGKLADRMPRPR